MGRHLSILMKSPWRAQEAHGGGALDHMVCTSGPFETLTSKVLSLRGSEVCSTTTTKKNHKTSIPFPLQMCADRTSISKAVLQMIHNPFLEGMFEIFPLKPREMLF